jgi:hypothetical protein
MSGPTIVAASAENFFESLKRIHACLREPRGKLFEALMRNSDERPALRTSSSR